MIRWTGRESPVPAERARGPQRMSIREAQTRPSPAEENRSLAEKSWEAVSRSDVAGIQKLWSPEIEWHATGRSTPWSGDHRGTADVMDHLARIGESVEIFDARLEDILVSDRFFAYLVRVHARHGERVLEVHYQLLCRVEEGLIREVWTLPLDPGALMAFWD